MLLRCVAFACLLAAATVSAQDTRGTISGTVSDMSGAVRPAVHITVTNTETNSAVSLLTNSTGFYAARLLLPGRYNVTAEAPGFKQTVRSNIILPLGQELEINLTLEIGATSESISVSGESPILETDSVSTGRSLTKRDLQDLPVMNNDIVIQAMLSAGVASNGQNGYVTQGMVNGSSQPYFAPGNVGGNEWSIDGAPDNGNIRRTGYTPNTDAVEELKVETSNFDASVGHSSGISVQLQTRSGTNGYHGTLSDSYWNTHWNAAGFYQKQAYYTAIAQAHAAGNNALADQLASKPITPGGHSNNYSATLGGPVLIPKIFSGKNRPFFFFSYSGAKDRQPARAANLNYTVPTAQERTGDFSDLLPFGTQYQIYDPLSVRADPARPGHFVRTPFPGDIVPSNRISNNVAYQLIAKYMPLPNTSFNNPTAVNYIATCQIDNSDYTALDNRTDYQATRSDTFSVRWSYSHYFEPQGDYTCTGIQSGDEVRVSKTATAAWTRTFNSSTVLSASLSGTSFIDRFTYLLQHTYKPSSVGLPGYMDQQCAARNACELPVFSLSGYQGIGAGGAGYPFDRSQTLKANLSSVHGRHTLRAGIDFRNQIHSDPGTPGNASGAFNFNNNFVRKDDDGNTPAASLGLTLAALMMGIPTTATIDNNSGQTLSNPYYGWYGEDTWRVRNNLTVTFGLRMEYELGGKDRFNRLLLGWDPTAQLPIAAAAQAAYAANPVPQLPATQFLVVGGNQYAGVNGAPRQVWASQLMYLPRASVAWHFTRKMVFRAGYGTYFDTLNVNNEGVNQGGYSRTTTSTISNDFGQSWLVGNPSAGISPLTDPFPIRADGTRFDQPYGNTIGSMYQAGRGYTYSDPDRRHAKVQKWRLGFQRELSGNMVVEAAYWGQFGSDLGVTQNLTPLPGSYYNYTEARNNTPANILNANVTNPFYIGNFAPLATANPNLYQVMSSNSFFSSKTIQLNKLIVPFPQMGGLSESNVPKGKDQINAVELDFTKRLSRGFNVNASYTWLRGRDKTTFNNPFDTNPIWLPANSSTPRRMTLTSIYELPFGQGKPLLHGRAGNAIAGGWQISATYQYQPGFLLGWGNLFYYGNLATIGHDLETGCKPACNQMNSMFNTSLPFEKISANTAAAYQARIFPQVIDGVRGDKQSIINANLLRNFKIREHATLQIRVDATNLQNRTQFNNPSTDPTSAQFGKVSGQTNTINRFYDIQARIQF